MLVAGSTSACDVCLEPFGRDCKTPCSISCGHVFCVDCLEHITQPSCPLCRKVFDPRFTVKLHLDLDNVRAPPSPNGTTAANEEQDARRLYQAISNIAEEGCSESQVRQLIHDGKSFLQKQPRDSFKDLRTLYRMVAYLTEVKTNLRAQNSANDALKREHASLQAEKNEVLAKLEQQARAREQERQNAWDTESTLREHCTKAHEAYETMVQQYNYVAKEWTRQSEEIKRLRSIASHERLTGSPSNIGARYSPHELDQASLVGAAVRDEGSILISPLPQFTTRFNTTMSLFKPLPDLEEVEEDDDEDDDDEEDDGDDDSEDSDSDLDKAKIQSKQQQPKLVEAALVPAACSNVRHPYGCGCVAPQSADDLGKPRANMAHAASSDRLTTNRAEAVKTEDRPFHIPAPSGISRTAPYAESRRSRSNSIPTSGSSRTPSSSRPSSRSVSPARPPVSSRPSSQRSTGSYENSSQSTPLSSTRTADNDGLRSRLHNLLADSSSSPPKPSISVSASLRDNRHAGEDRRRSASRSASPPSSSRRHSSQNRQAQQQQQQPTSVTDQFSRLLASHPPPVSGVGPPSTSPNPTRTSSASDAARALEQSKRERQQADRDRRIAEERERHYSEREGDRFRQREQPVSGTTTSASSAMNASSQPRMSTSPSKAMPSSGPHSTQQQISYQSRPYNTSTHKPHYTQSTIPSYSSSGNAPGIYA